MGLSSKLIMMYIVININQGPKTHLDHWMWP